MVVRQSTEEDITASEPQAGGPSSGNLFLTVFHSIMLPMFLAVADQTIVATALPAIASHLGGVERVSWIVVAYLIAATVAAPVYGRLGDTFGRRRMMFVALGVFMTASVLCSLSVSIEMLAAMRLLQGLGGGGLMTLSQALIGETIPPRERGRYQGYLAGVAVTSATFGPVAGGYLTQLFGWQSIFLINLPTGLLAVLLVIRLPIRPRASEPVRFDVIGLFLFALFIGCLILALEQMQRLDARALSIGLGLFVIGIGALALLWRHEGRTPFPLLPIGFMRLPSVWRADALAACHGAAMVSLITFLPIYLRAVRGAPPAEIGLLLLPLTVGIGIGSLISGRIVSKTGATAVLPSYGLIVATASLLFLAFWAPYLSIRELPWIFGLNALFMGTVMGVVQVTVQTVAGPQLLGAAAATVQFSRSVGAAFGTAAVGAVLFAALAWTDRETARQFGTLIEHGPDAMTMLTPARQAMMQLEIGNAFRAAFITIALFTGCGVWLAWTMPLRRI
jgi:EmrB/QacA subfamily drug resistance transporter